MSLPPTTAACSPPSPATDADLVSQLIRLSDGLSSATSPAPPFNSMFRRCRLLLTVFQEIQLLLQEKPLPSSTSLCLRELLPLLRRLKALQSRCNFASRTLNLFLSVAVASDMHEISLDLALLLDILMSPVLLLPPDVRDLVDLASRQSRRAASSPDAVTAALLTDLLSLIHDVEQEIVPDRQRLESIILRIGLTDASSCNSEIERLELEIADKTSEEFVSSMVAVVGLLRYAKCVLFGASTPRPDNGNGSRPDGGASTDDDAEPAPPQDFRCPVSLDIMRDPVVVAASGQTYDRESIARWFAAGHSTCPKTGQTLASLELIPNKALKNLISRWCRENGVAVPVAEVGSSAGEMAKPAVLNKAATEAARMTATFLVEKLRASTTSAVFSTSSTDGANRVVHEIRQLAKAGPENRAFVADAGAVPLLVPLLYAADSNLQLNAVTALLNLSILESNRRTIMHTDGAVDAIAHVIGKGSTWRAKENAAAAVLSLAGAHSYRRRLGRNLVLVTRLVELARDGPASSKKDAFAAILSLAGERDNIAKLVEAGTVDVAFASLDSEETAAAVIAALAKRGGAEAVIAADGAAAHLVAAMRHGTEWSRESAAAALVLLCRRLGATAMEEVTVVAGIECAVWELMASGSERGRRKAASLGRICRRWAAASAAANAGGERAALMPSVGIAAA